MKHFFNNLISLFSTKKKNIKKKRKQIIIEEVKDDHILKQADRYRITPERLVFLLSIPGIQVNDIEEHFKTGGNLNDDSFF